VLSAVFSRSGWIVPVFGAVALVGVVSHLARRSPLPSIVGPPLAAAAVLCWVTLLDAREVAVLGIIPGPAALHRLGTLTRAGFHDIHRLTTPVPDHTGIVLIATIALGAVALLVDLLAVALRRVALAGLPLLATITTCAGVGRKGIGVIAFVLAALGFLALLYADSTEQVRRWGARVGHGDSSGDGVSGLSLPAPLSRRIGAAAIGVGLVVPVIVPGLHDGIDRRHHPGAGQGTGHVITIDPIVSVSHDLRSSGSVPVLTYTTTDPDPGYLRLTSLDVFNGSSFSGRALVAPSSAEVNGQLPVPQPIGQTYRSTVQVSGNLAEHWLPLPVGANQVDVAPDWRFDAATDTVFSSSNSTVNVHYTVTNAVPQATATELRQSKTDREAPASLADIELPKTMNRSVVALAHRITRGDSSDYQRALDIQNYLTSSRFSYDVDIPPDTGPDALAHFLLKTRAGFCQQFATAMAAMARIVGIPSRVAVGFTRGLNDPVHPNTWQVTTRDAHAWPELYFSGFGWLQFEPTPRADGQAVAPGYAQRASHVTGGNASGGQGASPAPTATSTRKSGLAQPTHGLGGGPDVTTSAAGHHRSSGGGVAGRVTLIVLAMLLVAAAAPGVARRRLRRLRWRALAADPAAVSRAWEELADTARDLAVPWPEDRSPAETGRRLTTWLHAGSDEGAAIRRLVEAEQYARYAPTPPAADGTTRADVTTLVRAMRARRTGFEQLRAQLVPRSTIARWRVSRLRAWDRLSQRRWPSRLSGRRSAAASGPRAV
jgi:transglutaminase-like putative cysteine protease